MNAAFLNAIGTAFCGTGAAAVTRKPAVRSEQLHQTSKHLASSLGAARGPLGFHGGGNLAHDGLQYKA